MNPRHFQVYIPQFFFVLIIFCQSLGISQGNQSDRLFLDLQADTFLVVADTTMDSLQLPHRFIIPRSEKIYQNDFKLIRGVHFQLFENEGKLIFFRPVQASDRITVIYKKYPFPLINEYYHQELQPVEQTDTADTGGTAKVGGILQRRVIDEIDIYGSNLDKSGSIVRGVEIGSNRDLTLNSGLNLQLSGYITPEVQIVAALTDESTPIQPEGNTQTLNEVDKVFVKVNSPYLGGTLGDFNLSYRNSSFGNVNRKLQGITAHGEFGLYRQDITYATSRGTFNTNQFLGQEGNQGPYQLVGKNGEREIIVLAGTEKVYINGELQIRGENNQYIIDYSLGQIIFTNNRLITGEDRIEVDFEYSNVFQRYSKNFVGLSSVKKTLGSGFSYDVRFFREWDDTENLLEDSAPLTDEEKRALENAGSNPLQASVSGVDSVGPGNGFYAKRDTVIAGQNYDYFRYVGAGLGEYNVRFSNVGQNNGAYIRERLGIYRFVGPGFGNYLPIKLIPLPGDKKLVNVGMGYRLGRNFTIKGEGTFSLYDQNVFSNLDNENNLGQAFTLGANYLTDSGTLFGKNIGLVNWQIKWKRQEKEFSPLDRQFQPEFNYKWNITTSALTSNENSLESDLIYHPIPLLQIMGDVGIIERSNDLSSRRIRGEFAVTDSLVLKTRGYYEWVNSETRFQKSEWVRTGGILGKPIGKLFPYAEYKQENRKVNQGDTTQTGFYFQSGELGLSLQDILRLKWRFLSRVRDDYLYNPDRFNERLKLSRSFTHLLQGDILDLSNWQGRVSFIYRTKNFESFFSQLPPDSIPKYQPNPQFQDTSWINNKSYLGRIELQYLNTGRTIDSRWQYRIASELQALQEKVFVFVGENRGNYRFDEDLQEYVPDPNGDYLQIILPTGNFESVTNIAASWQFRYRPKTAESDPDFFVNILKNISFFSLLKVDERSRESDVVQLYILNFNRFHNNLTTVRGVYTIDQDIYFFERNPNFGITLRSRYRDNLSNEFVDSGFNETRTNWDRSINWRQSLLARKVSQELEYQQSIVLRNVASLPSRNRDIFGNIVNYTLNYRPVYAWQIQTRFEVGLQSDRAPANQIKTQYFEVRPQVNYAIAGKARAQSTITILNVNILENPFDRPLPFEMAKGKREGLSYFWNVRFEYFITSNITTTFNFSGRKDSGALRTIYLGQAEVRAFF